MLRHLLVSRKNVSPTLCHVTKMFKFFNAGLIRLFARIDITLLLNVQWKQHHISYVKIVYKYNMTC
jgi:hypothetical protein